MRFSSLIGLLFINIIWVPLEANGLSDAVQNPCRADDCGSRSTVNVNSLTVNIYPGHKNGVSELPPALRQLLAGLTATKNCNSTHQKLQLGGDVNQEVETDAPDPRESVEVTDAPGPLESVEVTDAPGSWESVELMDAPGPRDDRPDPDNYDVGSDGLRYFLGTERFDNIQECRGYCRRFRNFRLAIANTNETLNEMRKYTDGMVDLAIIRRGENVKLLWGDGTPLDRSILLASRGEPRIDQPGNSDGFAIWRGLLDDFHHKHQTPCLCQGSSERDLC